MRVQAFITSGVLEKYVLGMATEEEVEDVLEMASQHIEIKEELAAIRKTMRGYILSHKVAPPADLLRKVMTIGNKPVPSSSRSDSSSRSISPSFTAPKREKSESGGIKLLPIATALLTIALLAACFTAYSFFMDVEKSQSETAAALEESDKLKQQIAEEQKNTAEVQTKLDFYHNRDNRIVVLKGTNRSPNTFATIYWNNKDKSASLDLANLPNLTTGSVAVLWSNTGRTAQKIGVLAANPPGQRSTLTYVENSQLFYVTEERSPNVERPNRSRILMTGG